MSTYRIAVIVGSFREESLNRKLADALIQLAPIEFTFKSGRIDDLPFYSQDHEGHPAEPVQRLMAEVKAAQGVIFVTPEYNRSIPGVLKNAIDQCSRPWAENVWEGKPTAILGLSPGPTGTAMAQQHLRNILAYLDVPVMGQPEAFVQVRDSLFDETGGFGSERKQFFQNWMDRYVAWVKKHID
jgi:chromate reductase